jgi:PPOX class probable F420-dependent enzyme
VDIQEMRRRVGRAPVARLATIDPQERPHLVPVCFVLEGDSLYSAVDQKPKSSHLLRRLKNIERNPNIALLVDHYADDWSALWWIRLRGTARILLRGPERARAVALLTQKYPQYRAAPPGGAVIVISIDDWRGWSASETMTP